MTTYAIATGWDVALESLTPFDPQPLSVGLLYDRRQYAASGLVLDENPYWEYRFGLFEDDAQYVAVLTQCGLLTARTALVSATGPDDTYGDAIRNGVAVRPFIGSDGQRDFFLKGFVILVKSLRAQA